MIATMILDKQMSRPVAPTKTDDTILELNNVTRTFGAFKAVRGVSLKIRRGEFVTLLGPSGYCRERGTDSGDAWCHF